MNTPEVVNKLLEQILTEEKLNYYLQNTRGLNELNYLLEYKKCKISKGQSQKIAFPISLIFLNFDEIDLRCQIFKQSLYIIDKPEENIQTIEDYFVQNLNVEQDENYILSVFRFLNIIIEFVIAENKVQLLMKSVKVQKFLLLILQLNLRDLNNFLLLTFLPNFLKLHTIDNKYFLNKLIILSKQSNRIEIIFYLFDYFVATNDNLYLHFIEVDDFWNLLNELTTSNNFYLQKQSAYILSKAVNITLDNRINNSLLTKQANYNFNDIQKGWRNFFILLDISNEKQLHLIEPSLILLNSLKYLPSQYEISIYKLLLNHTQNTVSYYVSQYILQQEWNIIETMLPYLLRAVNKHEFSDDSCKFFQTFENYCKLSSKEQIIVIFEESYKISWVPTAHWYFYNSILNSKVEFAIDIELFYRLTNQLRHCPNVYVRKNCLTILSNYFINNLVNCTPLIFVKLATFFMSLDDNLFNNLIAKHKKLMVDNKELLLKQFFVELFEHEIEFRNIETLGRILIEIDKIEEVVKFKWNEQKNFHCQIELVFRLFLPFFEKECIEIYLEKRLGTVAENDNIDDLLILSQNQKKLIPQAVDILTDQSKIYNTNQKIIAFTIISSNDYCNSFIMGQWGQYITTNPRIIDRRILEQFLKLFLSTLQTSFNISIIVSFLEMQDNNLLIIIFQNLTKIINCCESDEIIETILDLSFNELLALEKNNIFENTATVLLNNIFQPENLKHHLINCKVFNLIIDLSKLSTFSRIVKEVAINLAVVSSKNPKLVKNYIPVIIDLILSAILINKNERIEYNVNQDISHKLNSQEKNPNIEQFSVKLFAIEAMLNIVKDSPDETTDLFCIYLMKKYNEHSDKRYFPDSQIHLQKLRILQALLLIYNYTKEQTKSLYRFTFEKVLVESDQISIRYLLQLLIILIIKKMNWKEQFIFDLKAAKDLRPSTKIYIIPILYQLIIDESEVEFTQLIEMLLPYTMGPQFKLRVYSQTAILKLYRKALKLHFENFIKINNCLYTSIENVIQETGNTFNDIINTEVDFLECFHLDKLNICRTIFYEIPKITKISKTEWENLFDCAKYYQFQNLSFGNKPPEITTATDLVSYHGIQNTDIIQKKITPWREILNDNLESGLKDFILVTSLIEKTSNLGGLTRTCEVFKIKQLVMRTAKITSDKEFKSLSMSSENWVDIMEVKVEDLANFLMEIKNKKFSVIGAEQTSDSVKLNEFCFPKKTALILGNEKEGIPPRLIPLLNKCVEIPQFGVIRSLNVHVAGAIMIWEYCKQHLL